MNGDVPGDITPPYTTLEECERYFGKELEYLAEEIPELRCQIEWLKFRLKNRKNENQRLRVRIAELEGNKEVGQDEA
jgi:hypothetical protein